MQLPACVQGTTLGCASVGQLVQHWALMRSCGVVLEAWSTSAVLLRGRAPAFISAWCLFHELLLHQLLVHQLFGASPAGCCFWRPRLHYRLLTLYPAAY
jgi:hypothetical protein